MPCGNQRDRRNHRLTIVHSALGLALPDTPETKGKEARGQEERESRKRGKESAEERKEQGRVRKCQVWGLLPSTWEAKAANWL